MKFLPIETMMIQRVDIARTGSDTDLFNAFMYLGEMLTKITAAGLVAAVEEGHDRNQYRLGYTLVHADGIGEWASVITDIVQGSASAHLIKQAREEQIELAQKNDPGTWQFDAVAQLDKCLKVVDPESEKLPLRKVSASKWFTMFSQLRNQTRGHGALQPAKYSEICRPLEKSIQLIVDNFRLFRRPWAYLHQNLSGTYRVTAWTDAVLASSLIDLKLDRSTRLSEGDGLYIDFGNSESTLLARKVDLIVTDIDYRDVFLPNGGWKDQKYELRSYITNDKVSGDSSSYLIPVTSLPVSETHGLDELSPRGESFVTLPQMPMDYVRRPILEEALKDELLLNEFHRIVTLIGRGGIGKTSLALSVLHDITKFAHFDAILWFSARDVDLMPNGPKAVKADILDEYDIAKQFASLINSNMPIPSDIREIDFLNANLQECVLGKTLFVFDNFETLHNPAGFYKWLDTYISPPNKALITTRHREFKGDYPLEVKGMSPEEGRNLIDITAQKLGILSLITPDFIHDLYVESDGHPYVIKMLIGEIAKTKKITKIERIVATQNNVLEALFERTYSRLSPVGKRVFLTLCNWRSAIPEVALEAVLLRPSNDKMDVQEGVNEVVNSSLADEIISTEDESSFLVVPLEASVFGGKKLSVSPMKASIEADSEILHYLGSARDTDIRQGITPRIERLFRTIARKVREQNASLEEHLPILEFLASQYPSSWLLLVELYEERSEWDKSENALFRYYRDC